MRFDALLLRWLVQMMRVGVASLWSYVKCARFDPSVLDMVLRRSRERVLEVGLLMLCVYGGPGEGATACHHKRLEASGCNSRGSP